MEALNTIKEELTEKYTEDSEISLEHVIEEAVNSKAVVLENKNTEWISRFLELTPEEMSHQELGKWVDETQPLPGFITDETREKYTRFKVQIDNALKEKRIAYIYFLFEQLTPDDREVCYKQLKSLI